jgi:uncharacterized membrane protein YciS (DUF1049 family)
MNSIQNDIKNKIDKLEEKIETKIQNGLSVGEIIGISVGSVVGVGLYLIFRVRNNQLNKQMKNQFVNNQVKQTNLIISDGISTCTSSRSDLNSCLNENSLNPSAPPLPKKIVRDMVTV